MAQAGPPKALIIKGSANIADHSEGFTEPSGLTLARDGLHFWSVSDDTGRIFLIGPDGDIKKSHTIKIHLSDLEGVAEDPTYGRILVVRERSSEIVDVRPAEGSAMRYGLAGMQGFGHHLADVFTAETDNGLEGITVDPDSGHVFLLKERDPRLLIEVSGALDVVLRVVELSADMGFLSEDADDGTLDVSGLAYDTERNGFWIVSDTGRSVFFLDKATMHATAYPMSSDKHFRNAEGIALVNDGKGLKIVTDAGKESRLFTLEIE